MRKFVIFITVLLLVAAGGYGVLDAYDRVPGFLTTRAAIPEPAAYPEIDVTASAAQSVITADNPLPVQDITAAADELVAGAAELGSQLSLTMVDAATGQEIYTSGADTGLAPASSLKVLTAAAALQQLGPETQLATTATWDGTTLTLVGGGDVLLSAGASTGQTNGYASLTDLAAQVAAELDGVTAVQLAVDDSIFTGSPYASTWSNVDLEWVMPVTALAVDHGLISGTSYVSDPALDAAAQFATALEAEGITVSAGPVSATASDDARTVGTVRSAPIADQVRYMLKASDNSVAEVLARLVALSRGQEGSATAGTAAVVATLTELGLPTQDLVLADACGLSFDNQVTSRLLVDTVLTSWDEPRLRSLTAALPVAALDGTLAQRIQDAPGRVRAKTGTLTQTVSLTGIVQTTDGSTVVFSAVLSGFAEGLAWDGREVLDTFVTQVAQGSVEP